MSESALKKAKTEGRSQDTIPSRVQWVALVTENTKKSGEFYEKVLGWKADSETKMAEHWMEVKGPQLANRTNISLHSTVLGTHKAGTAILNMVVKSLEQFHQHVKDIEGLKVLSPPTHQPWGGFLANYECPDGVLMSVMEDWHRECMDKSDATAESNGTNGTHHENGANGKSENGKAENGKAENGHVYDTAKAEEKKAETENKSIQGNGICHLEIPCESKDRAMKFYKDTFGWAWTMWGEEAFFKSNDPEYKLEGGLILSKDRINTPSLYLNVVDIENTLEKVKANGGKVVKDKYTIMPVMPDRKAAHVADTEGNIFALYCDEAKHRPKQ